jgi:hypothetical protein
LSSGPTEVFPDSAERGDVVTNFVGPGWFETYGIPVRAGRDFGAEDTSTAPRVTIVNEAFVRRFLPAKAPLGVITTRGVIVGVVGDAVSRSAQRIPGTASLAFREAVPPTMYSALAQVAPSERVRSDAIRLSVRTTGSPNSLVPGIGAALTAVDPDVVFQFHALSSDVETALAQERLSASVAGAFSLMALVLTLVGIFGVTSDAASRRRVEIGIRTALGSTRAGIVRVVVQRTLQPIVAGIVVGTMAAAAITRVISTQLFGITALDPVTFIAVPAAVAALALAFMLVPAIRAAGRDPSQILQGRQ